MKATPDQGQWSALGALIAAKLGLHFSPERVGDLKRSVAAAAGELGFDDAGACVQSLLSSPLSRAQLDVLAAHLTIGETYFFRETQTFDALAQRILPELIRARRGRDQRLRIWSAACCTGEEAYSLAILLRQSVPTIADWQVTITATDLNSRFLRKAVAGVYRDWSFRNIPESIKRRYFTWNGDGSYTVAAEIRNMVTFSQLNLVQDVYPSIETGTNAMDVIFCRNVLMYFDAAQAGKVAENLRRSLVPGGWLAVAPSEASSSLCPRLATVNFPGAILFQNRGETSQHAKRAPLFAGTDEPAFVPHLESVQAPATALHAAAPAAHVAAHAPMDPLVAAKALYEQGLYPEAIAALLDVSGERELTSGESSVLARALANQGKLDEALAWCGRWIAADKVDAAAHYYRGVVLLERGEAAQARASLQRAVYLQPDCVLAHFALGNLERSGAREREAARHFTNVLRLLSRYRPDDPLPESEGMTAGRLTEIVTTMTPETLQ